ncbi:MAG: ATP-binding protein, partial [Anaerolineales bacterium]|nr:ATP-binding protein [Anaerolineales bacterium]
MAIPRFLQENINPKLMRDGVGDAFQEFVHDVLGSEFPDLHVFPGGGKDGVIDLSSTSEDTRVVIECKFISEDGLSNAQRRWREVAEKLSLHLSSPEGPTKHQSQYTPWYRTSPRISRFIFCVSSELSNQEQVDQLYEEIKLFFQKLAESHDHLKHLVDLPVQVIDWREFSSKLKNRPHILFRWFPKSRPQGLVPFEEVQNQSTFRAYLTSEKLPYFSREQYLAANSHVKDIKIQSESDFLDTLKTGDITGLIVTGTGGVGKTRLANEIVRYAQNNGWLTLRVLSRIRGSDLEDLAEVTNPDTQIILLFDYIETQRDFSEIEQTINDLNDTFVLQIRYVASCRTSYYNSLPPSSRRQRIDLSPIDDAEQSWNQQYQHEVVRHILENAGVAATEEHFRVCHDIPIFAVFMSFLQVQERYNDLDGLLRQSDFGVWVNKRIQLSFRQTKIDRELALMICLFPLKVEVVSNLPKDKYVDLFDALATDGWIEKLQADETRVSDTWDTAHDTLADQIALTYLQGIPYTATNFIEELLSLAVNVGCLRSAVLTLQRIADQPPLSKVDWQTIFKQKMKQDPYAWREIRDLLVRTSLLSPVNRIDLFAGEALVWQDAWKEVEVQNSLGWLARWSKGQMRISLDAGDQTTLQKWIQLAAPYTETSNYLLTWGLHLCPDLVKEYAFRWISAHPFLFQTHYLLVAWLKCGLPKDEIYPFIKKWISRHPKRSQLSFILAGWFNAGGDKESMREALDGWLKEHGDRFDAQYVYKSWLGIGGERAAVREALRGWIKEHGNTMDASFIYRSWLEAGGDKELVREALGRWLAEHGNKAEARFVYKSWLEAGGDKDLVLKALGEWIKEHGSSAEARFVYKGWLEAGGDKEVVREALGRWLAEHGTTVDADFVCRAWLETGGDKELVREALAGWLAEHGTSIEADFVCRAWLEAGGDKKLVREALAGWLTEHGDSLGASFLYQGWLDAGGDKELVRDALGGWLKLHGNSDDADFVCRAWLDAGGEKELVREALHGWLQVHGNSDNADFVCKAWLEAGGEKGLVREALAGWLKEHGNKVNASFVHRAWLDAGGDKGLVRESLGEWVKEHGRNMDAQYVYKTWLDAGGDIALVHEPLKGWLQEHGNSANAQYVYKSWLDAEGDIALVLEPLKGWLKEHGKSVPAQFVYKSWLDAGGDKEVVLEPLKGWLIEHGNSVEADFVCRGWLKANGDKELIRETLSQWLKAHGSRDDAQYIYRARLEAGGDVELVREGLSGWLEKHGSSDEARFVYRAWLEAGGEKELVREGLKGWLEKHGNQSEIGSSFIYQCWLNAKGDLELVADNLVEWIKKYGDVSSSIYIYKIWLDAGGKPELIQEELASWLEIHGLEFRARFIYHSWLDAGAPYAVIQAPL